MSVDVKVWAERLFDAADSSDGSITGTPEAMRAYWESIAVPLLTDLANAVREEQRESDALVADASWSDVASRGSCAIAAAAIRANVLGPTDGANKEDVMGDGCFCFWGWAGANEQVRITEDDIRDQKYRNSGMPLLCGHTAENLVLVDSEPAYCLACRRFHLNYRNPASSGKVKK